MAIVGNKPCPACRENGHDKTGNHLIVFENGAGYCGRHMHHKDGKPFHAKPDEMPDVSKWKIDGTIQYSESEFRKLEKKGAFKDEYIRQMALSGMKPAVRYSVMTDEEQKVLEDLWESELRHFETLSVRDLVARGIPGHICKLYDVRVGVNKKKKVDRHYYPRHSLDTGVLVAAKCRNLPKDFTSGSLGCMHEEVQMFGQHTLKKVTKSGARKDILTITGGELDSMAAQYMLCESRKNTQWEGVMFHVWSVTNGEAGLDDIVRNLKHIKKFKKVILAFDDDKAGRELTNKVRQLLREKAVVLQMPSGCNDPNQCLMEEREEEFVDAWWKADSPSVSSVLTAADLFDEATKEVEWGLDWPWPSVTKQTYGIRPHNLYVIGGGSGTGKTEIAKETIQYLTDHHKRLTGVIFMEEMPSFTLKVLAGKWANKKLHLPKNRVKKGHPDWVDGCDYTEEESIKAITQLVDKDKIRIAATKGDNSVDNIIALMEELRAMGCSEIFIDNLTTITHNGKSDNVKAIDETMKRFGTYMQETPVSIFLLSHLSKPDENRVPFEEGGMVKQSDFRGSQSIAFWATFMLAVERDTMAEDDSKFVTTLRCVKDRLTGVHTGETTLLVGNPRTGRLLEPDGHAKNKSSSIPDKKKKAKKVKTEEPKSKSKQKWSKKNDKTKKAKGSSDY